MALNVQDRLQSLHVQAQARAQKDLSIEGMHLRRWSSKACVTLARRMRRSGPFTAFARCICVLERFVGYVMRMRCSS